MSRRKKKRMSPSKLAYLEKCPRFRQDNKTSEAAERGTAMHKALETGSNVGLDEEELEAVELCRKYVDNLINQPNVKSVHREVQLTAMTLNHQIVEGTADLVVEYDDFSVDVVDYKTGLSEIEDAKTNLQGWCYILGAIKKFRCLRARVIFLMPRQGEVSEFVFTPVDIGRIRLRLLKLAALLRKRRRPYVPNDFSCDWCDDKSSCPGLARRAMAVVSQFQDVGFPVPQITDLDKPIDPETRGQLQSLAVILSDWCAQVKKANATYMDENPTEELPGFKLISRRGNRSLLDTLLVAQVLRSLGVDDDRIIASSSLKVSEVEQMLMEMAPNVETRGADETEDEWVIKAMDSLEQTGLITRGANICYLKKVKQAKKELTDGKNES